MQAENELKPCPFCGNTHEEEFTLHKEDRIIGAVMWTVYNVSCSCGARGPDSHSREEAVERWNRGRPE
jgi:Lar family restriction alleviation protein